MGTRAHRPLLTGLGGSPARVMRQSLAMLGTDDTAHFTQCLEDPMTAKPGNLASIHDQTTNAIMHLGTVIGDRPAVDVVHMEGIVPTGEPRAEVSDDR